jgi:hypothetical protein
LDWRKFTEKMSTGSRAHRKTIAKEEKISLEDWSRYFGIDPDTLK